MTLSVAPQMSLSQMTVSSTMHYLVVTELEKGRRSEAPLRRRRLRRLPGAPGEGGDGMEVKEEEPERCAAKVMTMVVSVVPRSIFSLD